MSFVARLRQMLYTLLAARFIELQPRAVVAVRRTHRQDT